MGLPIPAAEPPDDIHAAAPDGGPSSDVPPEDIHALIASFRPDALRVARRLVRTQAEAEDLTQTALMKVLARAHAISDPSLVRPYLTTTVRNLWRNQLRAGRRVEPARDQDMFERLAAPEPEVPSGMSGIDAQTLEIAMQTLSKAQAELIKLRYVDRLDYATIGRRYGISAPTARQRVHRAREHLRNACFTYDADTSSRRICHITRVRLGRFAQGGLPRKVAGKVALHVRSCDECRDAYTNLIDVLGLEPSADLFPDPEQ